MNFSDYQKAALQTAIYPGKGNNFTYPTLGLCGEAGEVAEKVKKLIRDKNSVPDEEFLMQIQKELGDVLWYVAVLADEFGLSLEYIAMMNIAKLQDRMDRGKLQGNGDER